MRASRVVLAVVGVVAVAAVAVVVTQRGRPTPEEWPAGTPTEDPSAEARIDAILQGLTLEQRVGQLIQAELGSVTPADLAAYPLGSVLVGGNGGPLGRERAAPEDWLAWTGPYREVSGVPLLIGVDAVHGHNNVVGAVIFPHNIALGAIGDPNLVRRIGEATAEAVAATGFNWNFAPTVAVARDARWGRTYESFGADPALVARLGAAMVEGLQASGRVAATAKHFVGDGGTLHGIDQGDAKITERELIDVHAAGHRAAIDAGALTVMASFSSWRGVKMHGNRGLLTDVLKGRMGFGGLVIGDWNGHGQLSGCTDGDCPQAVNAGIDVLMAPHAWKELYTSTLAHARSGRIPAERIDDAVRRVLRVKLALGLFDPPREPVPLARATAAEHRALAREAVRRSLVKLKDTGVLPIDPGARVLVVGHAADDIGTSCGGWTLSWQGDGNTNADFPNGQSIFAGIAERFDAELSPGGAYRQKPDVAVVVIAEPPYAEGKGDLPDLALDTPAAVGLLERYRAEGISTITVLVTGRPRGIDDLLAASDAVVVAWLPGTEGGGVADGLATGEFPGVSPQPWP